MTLYKCECGQQEEEVYKAKIIFKDGNWVADVVCKCNNEHCYHAGAWEQYMVEFLN